MHFKNHFTKLFIFFGVIFLTSCATTSNITSDVYDKKTINPEDARLVFNRTKTLLYSGVDARIEINGNVVTKLSNGSSFYYDLPAGRTNITVYGFMDPGEFSVDLTLVKSKIYEFKVSPRGNLFLATFGFGMLGLVADTTLNKQSGNFQITVDKFSNR